MNSYSIIEFDFTRNDGLVSVKIRPKVGSQEKIDKNISNKQKSTNMRLQTQDQSKKKKNHNLIKDKYRCLKIDIQYLKRLLKRSYNVKEFKEFYRIYGPKLIEIDFGNIELFNLKGLNQYSIEEILKFNKEYNIFRWGKLFSTLQLQKYYDGSQIEDQIAALQFYNLLVRERIFTLRTLRYYKDDKKRKEFPYQYLYVYDLEDCLQFNLQAFQETSGQIKIQTSSGLLSMKQMFFKQQYQNFQFENIIVPFFQVKTDEPRIIQLFFVHFSKTGYKLKEQRIGQDEQQNDDQDQLFKCYIFVNFDTSYYNQPRLMNGVQEFAQIHNFEFTQGETKFINVNSQQTTFVEQYVEYIETEFFQQEKTSCNSKINYIFNKLPKEMTQKRFNDILNDKFIIPENIESIMEQFFGNQ